MRSWKFDILYWVVYTYISFSSDAMFLKISSRFFSWILSLRYRITFKNIEILQNSDQIVVFPNHPALVDPMILLSHFTPRKILSPLMTETYFHTPWLGPIIRALKTVPVGDISRGGNIDDVNAAFTWIENALAHGQNLLVYPSGHIYVQPFEHIVGKKMGYEIVWRISPDTRIITVRTRGLWGSMWWKAYTGKSPALMKVMLRSIWYILANGIFFVPKRSVEIELRDMTENLREWYELWLDGFNQKLQDYYNEPGNEPCRFIPHYFYQNDVQDKVEPTHIEGSIAELTSGEIPPESEIPEDVVIRVKKQVAEIKKIPLENLTYTSHLILDLHADSLDMAEIKSSLQAQFDESTNPPISLLKTIADLCLMVLWKLKGEEQLPPCHFLEPWTDQISFQYKAGDTILSKAKEIFRKDATTPYIYDTILGQLTRQDFLLKSYVIGTYLKKYKNERIGIMVPALASTSLLIFGSYLAGKLPVMLNWTVGEKSFAHCMQFSGLDTILTSRKFYEKIQSPWLKEFEGKMVFIEDIIRDISITTKLSALIKKFFFLIPPQKNEAVMLFTSGSESLPKAVVLTHENILSNIAWALQMVPFKQYETIIGFLPPFHSFGFTINTIFPFVAPVQVAYTPDPGDAKTIWNIIQHTHASIVSATPTFLRMTLSGNAEDTLKSLKYAFVWAEKCSDEVFSLFAQKCPEGVILEWYGITECSPIVTVNPLEKQKRWSAGKFLPEVTYRVISLESKKPVPNSEQGMIYVAWPSIFEGYVDADIDSPFEEFEGKKWYKTWDLGYVDDEWFLFITGRLKRFVKIAGEMISLPFIEGMLLEKYGNSEITTLAIEAKEENGSVTIAAFTTFDTTIEELNQYIHTHGASNLVKISQIKRLEVIPLLGTGKTDYKFLKSSIE